ncbi:MAG: secretin N-terminal domain-containing protein, partial [Planctomycetaceae bacterium]
MRFAAFLVLMLGPVVAFAETPPDLPPLVAAEDAPSPLPPLPAGAPLPARCEASGAACPGSDAETSKAAPIVYQLKYRPVAEVAAEIDARLRKRHGLTATHNGLIVESKVVLVPDPHSNGLLVVAAPEYVDEVHNLIAAADREPTPIEIEMQVTLIDDQGRESVLSRPTIRTQSGRDAVHEIGFENGRRLRIELTPRDLKSDADPLPWDEPEVPAPLPEPMVERPERFHRVISVEDHSVQLALAAPLALTFEKMPLQDAIRQFATKANVNFVVDNRSLEECGVTPNFPVTRTAADLLACPTLGAALDHILKPLGLGYIAEDQCVKITSRERCRGPVYVVAYSVADLVTAVEGVDAKERYKELIECITGMVDPYRWEEHGGQGSIRAYETTHALVVRQTADAHKQIRELLELMRGAEPADEPSEEEPAGRAIVRTAAVADSDDRRGELRVYPVADLLFLFAADKPRDRIGNIRPEVRDAAFKSLMELVTATIEPHDWLPTVGHIGRIHAHPPTGSL